jgi:hypothetical protein
MSKRSYGVMVGFVALGLAIGCDGDSNTFQSNLPPNKRLADLTPAERDQLCMDLRMVDTTATDAQLRATCFDSTSQCIANGVTTTCEPMPATCTATVGEFGACLSDSSRALQSTTPCSAVRRATLASTIAALQNQPPSQTCTTLDMKCPGMTTAMATSTAPLSVYEQRAPE